jgi:hypothetical protein
LCVAGLYRGAQADARSRGFAVLSTQVSTVGLRLTRDAVAAGKERLVSCSAEQNDCCSYCIATLDPCGDLPFTSWGRWQCLRGGADGLNSCMPPAVAAKNIGVRPFRGETCGDVLEAIARIGPSQPNEAMPRCLLQSNGPKGKISLDPSYT